MRRRQPKRGFLLIIVLVVVMVLALGAYAFSELMLSHQEASQLGGKQLQSRVMTESAAELVRMTIALDEPTLRDQGGVFNNPLLFQGVLVIDDLNPEERGRFTVLTSGLDDQGFLGGIRYGLEDDSTRLNLNALAALEESQPGVGRQLLMALPNCTEEIADAILDWIDADDEPREFGAEIDYYSTLVPPYAPKNGPLDTVEELLLVTGVTPELLFGIDLNRNGVIDPFEQTQPGDLMSPLSAPAPLAQPSPTTTTDPAIAEVAVEVDTRLGWTPYLTLFSKESNTNASRQPRVFVNQTDMQLLYDQLAAVLPEDWAKFIVAYRQFGPSNSTATGSAAGGSGTSGSGNGAAGRTDTQSAPMSTAPTGDQPASGGGTGSGRGSGGRGSGRGGRNARDIQLDLTQPGTVPLVQVLDLIGATVQVGGETYDSPFSDQIIAMGFYLPVLLDNVSVNDSPIIPGRININQASRTVLAGIPGMTEEILSEILSRRNAEPPPELLNRKFETWLMAEGIVTLQEMKLLTPFICAGGDVYRAQIIGYYEGGNASSRAEVVFDATAANPRILFWRDLSNLGRGFALETLGMELIDPTATPMGLPMETVPQQ